jgi:hypothetical protein
MGCKNSKSKTSDDQPALATVGFGEIKLNQRLALSTKALEVNQSSSAGEDDGARIAQATIFQADEVPLQEEELRVQEEETSQTSVEVPAFDQES